MGAARGAGPTTVGVAALAAVSLALAGAAGCGQTGTVAPSGSTGAGAGGGVITGAGGGHTTSTSSSGGSGGEGGSGGSESAGTGGSAEEKLGPPYPVVLLHGFFGFDKFAGIEGLPYFYHVPERLLDDGEDLVFTPAVDPFNSSDVRADQIITHVEDILEATGYAKVILIGHSQGGLDARAVATKRPDLVAAVMTVATPHHGSPVADIALGLTEDPNAAAIIDKLVQLIGGPLYDQVGDETSIAKALYLFSQPGSAEFNATHPDQPGIYYGSITGRTDYSLGGQECAPDFNFPLVTALHTVKDPVDPFFVLSEGIIDGGIGQSIPNDGLVRVTDAKWGEFWGCVPADHMDEVGQLVGDGPGLLNAFDHGEMFSQIVKRLREMGY